MSLSGLAETVQERLFISCSQYLGIVVGLVSVIGLGLSVHHDVQWNGYVTDKFNLNVGVGVTKLNAKDYMEVESQQEWIDLLERPHLLETIVICLLVLTVVLKGIHLIASPESYMPQSLNGGFIYLLSAFLEATSAILIITSIVAGDDIADQIMELIYGPKVNWPDSNSTSPIAAQVNLYLNVHCNNKETKWVAPKQCQLIFAKLLVTILCFLNALISFTVSFNLICNTANQVKPFRPAMRTRRILSSFGIKNPPVNPTLSCDANEIDLESFQAARLATDNDELKFQLQLLTTTEEVLKKTEHDDNNDTDSI